MVDNLTQNWKGIKLIGLLSFLVLFLPVFSRGDTGVNNKKYADEKVEQTITGTIKDNDSGEPLIGVNVLVKGTSRGTITDFDGNYSIDASEGDVLVLGYPA